MAKIMAATFAAAGAVQIRQASAGKRLDGSITTTGDLQKAIAAVFG